MQCGSQAVSGAVTKSMTEFPKRDNKVYRIVEGKLELREGNVPAKEILTKLTVETPCENIGS